MILAALLLTCALELGIVAAMVSRDVAREGFTVGDFCLWAVILGIIGFLFFVCLGYGLWYAVQAFGGAA